jgi:ABC-type transport system involved in multi-copper enzyme maturation permease subunit
MNKILPVAAITLKEGIRNRALQGILGVGGMLCLVYLAVMPMFSFERSKVMVDLVSASLSVAGLVIVIFLSVSMLTKDIHQRSVCMILSRPVSRTAYVIGKFSGLAIMVRIATLLIAMISFAASYIGAQFSNVLEVPRNFSLLQAGLAYLLKYLGMIVLLALAFLFTMVTTNEYLSMLLTAMTYLIGNSLETIVKVASVGSDVELSPVYLNALKLLTWIFPNLGAFDLKVYVAYGLALPLVQVAWTMAYGICYIALVVTLVVLVFNRKEIR